MYITSKRSLMIGLAIGLGAALTADAQIYVQEGQVLDASGQLGSGGLNRPGRSFDPNAANRLITGNVAGGYRFQGFSPVRDPSRFYTVRGATGLTSGVGLNLSGSVATSGSFINDSGLPSETLSNFRRDSLSTYQARQGVRLSDPSRPYYSPSGTILNTGAITAGLNRPGTSEPRNAYMIPREQLRLEPARTLPTSSTEFYGRQLESQPQLMRIQSGQPVTGQVNPRLLETSLFTGVRPIPLDTLTAQADREASLSLNATSLVDTRFDQAGPVDTRADLSAAERGPLGAVTSPLDRVLLGPDAQGGRRDDPGAVPGTTGRPERMGDGSVLAVAESGDVYRGMLRATRQLARPLGRLGEDEAEDAEPGGPLLSPEVDPAGAPREMKRQIAQKVTREPLRSFVGTAETALNKQLARAEDMLAQGQYYKAVGRYDFARALDVDNPLPLLGRSMALLGAGDYLSSANSLFQAIQQFESLANFPVDLGAFVTDIEVLDRRRADLERRLERFDDFRLRFLLGYAEYSSGLEEQGLKNMEQAAEVAPEELDSIPRFVDMLRRRTQGPALREQDDIGR